MAKRGSNPVLKFVVLLVLLGGAGWGFRSWLGNRDSADDADDSTTVFDGSTDDGAAGPRIKLPPGPGESAGAHEGTNLPTPTTNATAEQIAEAAGRYRAGLKELDASSFVEARRLLSTALASGLLKAADARQCRTRLTEIAERLIFSREIHPGDPYTREYRIQPGDTLSKIVKREKVYVPHQGIQSINGIADPLLIRPNQEIKLVQGPFDAIITKHTYTLDLYHHGMFVHSFRIGLGQNGSTPLGRWLVRDRVPQAPWTPPPTAEGSRTIECGQPGYPLGAKGLWIALEGLDTGNEMVSGFGIHGTDEPDSIGKQASLGCVRLRDDDIAMVFDLLYRGKSEVLVRP